MRGGQATTPISPSSLMPQAMAYVNTLNMQAVYDVNQRLGSKFNSDPAKVSQISNLIQNLRNQQPPSPGMSQTEMENNMRKDLAYKIIADKIVYGVAIPTASTTSNPTASTTSNPTASTSSLPAEKALLQAAIAKVLTMSPGEIANLSNTANSQLLTITPAQRNNDMNLMNIINPLLAAASNKARLNRAFGTPI